MTYFKKFHSIAALAAVALLLATAMLAVGLSSSGSGNLFAPAAARADDGDDKGERRINRTRGNGLKACQAAKKRTGGGVCTRVVEDRDDRERYEVSIRTRSYRYEIDLSRTFRVLEVERDRIGGDDDDDDDDDD